MIAAIGVCFDYLGQHKVGQACTLTQVISAKTSARKVEKETRSASP
jgi:hypothetical protein